MRSGILRVFVALTLLGAMLGVSGPAAGQEKIPARVGELVALSSEIGPVVTAYEAARADDPAFGGLWLDTEGAEPMLVVANVAGAAPKVGFDESRIPIGVSYVAVDNSLSALNGELVRLVNLEDKYETLTFGAYVDVRHNRVVILPEAGSPFGATEVDLLELDPSLVVVGETVYSDATSYKGGQAQTNGPSGGDAGTAGFMVKKTSGSGIGTLTAGHIQNSNVYQQGVAPGPVAMGNATYEKFSGNADRQIMPATAPYTVSRYLVNGQLINGQTSLFVGSWFCKYGKTSGTRCGYVDSINFHPPSPPYPAGMYDFILANTQIPAIGGDSGGPSYQLSKAVGITSGCTTTDPLGCDAWPRAGYWNKAFITKIGNALSGTGYGLY